MTNDVFFILPKEPGSAMDLVSTIVENARIADEEEARLGADAELADVLPYDAKQQYEYTVDEIAEEIGLGRDAVKKILTRCRHKLMRRFLISAMLPVAEEDEIIQVIRGGEKEILNKLSLFF
jgi:predicted transcriptional regulator